MKRIDIVTAVIRDEHGRWLLDRKKGSTVFIKPGGKREPAKDDLTALAREIREELACDLLEPVLLGVFEAPAANEPDTIVRAVVYLAGIEGQPNARAEIQEVLWIDPDRPEGRPLARLLVDQVLPAVKAL